VRWTPDERRSLDGSDAHTRIATDVVRSDVTFTQIVVTSQAALDAVAVSTPPRGRAPAVTYAAALEVPELSQYVPDSPGERGWCSAAALAMLLRFHGREADVPSVARAVFDSAYNGTGNWAFNVAYAGALGLRGVVAYLQGIDHVAAFVAAGLPVAISISWREGQLTGAPLPSSDGHLVVVRGIEPGHVLVNDPAQPGVAVRYARAELDAIFRAHGGVAYLVAPRARTRELVALADLGERDVPSRDQPQDTVVTMIAVRNAPLHIVLVEPQIPPNTGNVARLCAATGCALHLVEPLGFRIDDRELKRAGLDYWEQLNVVIHPSLDEFSTAFKPERMWFISTRGTRPYSEARVLEGDVLVFGKETSGLPQWLLDAYPSRTLRIPMREGAVRSLNLSTSVGIVAYAALGRLGFPNLG
jgi:tRNA (cytidine/uridine-2'-O-)-methyltransferase